MLILFIGGLALLAVAVSLVLRGVGVKRTRTAESLEQIHEYGYSARPASAGRYRSRLRSAIDGIATNVGDTIARRSARLAMFILDTVGRVYRDRRRSRISLSAQICGAYDTADGPL